MEMALTKNEREEIDSISAKVDSIQKELAKIKNILTGVAIGLTIGGILFGVKIINEIVHAVK